MAAIIPLGTKEQEEEEEEEETVWLFVPEVCADGAQQSWQRESLQDNPAWPKGLNGLKKWWRGTKLRFSRNQKFQFSLLLLQLRREGRRCNNQVLLMC